MMPILSFTFTLLTLCGCWQPRSWQSSCKKLIYGLYSAFVIFLVHTLPLSQLMDMIVNVENAEEFMDNSYVLVMTGVTCCKMINLLMNQKYIVELTDTLVREPFEPMDIEEEEIHEKSERILKINAKHYISLVQCTVVFMAITAWFTSIKKGALIFRAWLPFDYSTTPLFVVALLHQFLAWNIMTILHVASDTLICGCVMKAYWQFQILECRLRKSSNKGKNALTTCVRHHDRIYRFAHMINQTFGLMIFIQFVVSTLVMCFGLWQLVKIKSSVSKLFATVMYVSCMLTQIFLYCWCGNEVKLKSLQLGTAIYQLDWISLDRDAQRILLMIMRRSIVPVEFTSFYVISMNIDSFVKILQTSYSAYNMLQQSQREA